MSRFTSKPALIGMIHVPPLPGSPFYSSTMAAVLEATSQEAMMFERLGFDGIIIENMHDTPYLNGRVGPETTAAMTAVATTVRRHFTGPCGIQILAAANKEALAVALAAELDFIRAEGYVFAHVADEGIIQAQAGELLRYRQHIGAAHIHIWADIKKKHSSHAITADVDLVETAKAADFFRADGLIVTGASTGVAADSEDLNRLTKAVKLPVYVGSGISPENVAHYAGAHGFIVGSSLKEGGHWAAPLDEARMRAIRKAVDAIKLD